MGEVVYLRGSTRKVAQVTGERDRQLGVDTLNLTESRFGLFGTDLGVSLEHDGRLWFLFGDTVSAVGYSHFRPEAGDSIAFSVAQRPQEGLKLTFLTAPDGKYRSPRVQPPIPMNDYNVPAAGFSAGGEMYVYFTTDAFKAPDGSVKMGRTVLTRLVDEQEALFTSLYTLSDFRRGGKFINLSTAVVNAATIPGLPAHHGQGLLIWGSGEYRGSDPYLAYVPLSAVEDRGALRYFAGRDGQASWSSQEHDATPLFHHPQIGEFSVAWLARLRGWLMLYGAGEPRGINFRVSPTPWGPWSPTNVLFDPWADGGYCHFVHASYRDHGRCDAVHDPGRENEWGGEYAPYLIPRFTRTSHSEVTIHFLLSTWNPYNTVLMRSTLQLNP